MIVDAERHIVAAGYNGAPPGMKHCWHDPDVPPIDDEQMLLHVFSDASNGCVISKHAEENALHFGSAAIDLIGTTAYVTMAPCVNCARLLIAHGVRTVVYSRNYRDPAGLVELTRNGVTTRYVTPRQDVYVG